MTSFFMKMCSSEDPDAKKSRSNSSDSERPDDLSSNSTKEKGSKSKSAKKSSSKKDGKAKKEKKIKKADSKDNLVPRRTKSEESRGSNESKQEKIDTDRESTEKKENKQTVEIKLDEPFAEPWTLMPEDHDDFQKRFIKADDDEDGFVTRDQIQVLFADFNLEKDVLIKIWDMVDKRQMERLDMYGYMIVRYLVRAISSGLKLPEEIPNSLSDSVMRRTKTDNSSNLDHFLSLRGVRGRSNAFYSGPVSVGQSHFEPSYSSSGGVRPSKKPKIQHEKKIRSESSRFKIGFADTIGRRPHMEDEIVIMGHFAGREDCDYIGLFDGHGGNDASLLAGKNLHVLLEDKLTGKDPEEGLKDAFVATNAVMKTERIKGGTTAIVALFLGDNGFIANAGDSRAVLCQSGIATRYSTDHKPDLPEESKRIKELGGIITTTVAANGRVISRVCHTLSVARALGDFQLEPFISCIPEVRGPINIQDHSNQFLILACDGLWDVVTDQEAVTLVVNVNDPEEAAITLRDYALEKGSEDNVSVVVIRFPPFEGEETD
eukprot:TRINITY_DN2859_c0_g1_i1.p1 TRINITY_DN2859_c0_g1~~TRINITY_DN2859_c0_g1_i1.p1  ORF type:complete len:545 (-),score=137.82 TRINITY_DN2859_c0_g1_i1:107-1741(-)